MKNKSQYNLIPILLCSYVLINLIYGFEIINPIPPYLVNVLELILYIIVAYLFILNKEDFPRSNIDKLSLYIIVLFSGILRVPFAPTETLQCTFFYISFLVLSFFFLNQIRSYDAKYSYISNGKLKWTILGMLCGILLSGIATIPYIIQNHTAGQAFGIMRNARLSIFIPFLSELISSMSHAAIIEEPIYRGFTFGYLRGLGADDNKILVLQTVLFLVAHLGYIRNPYTIFVMLPMSGLVFGWLALNSKSIFPSMIAHALYNALRVYY